METNKEKYDRMVRCSECGIVVEKYKSTNESSIVKGHQVICDLCWRQINRKSGEIEKRLTKLEKELLPELICDNCGGPATFQTGKNKEGKIASWCSEECEKTYLNNN